ncbi:MAG: hypothetical protein ABI415_09200 [Flavitalea sp.]
MKRGGNIFFTHSPGRLISVALMAFCLIFLTSINYFQYPGQKQSSEKISCSGSDDSSKNFPPSGPTEEKASGGGLTILEELLHESHLHLSFEIASPKLLHQMEDAGRILAFHGELVSPPPEL